MKVTARDMLSLSFNNLQGLIDIDVIKPGTQQERDYLKVETEQNLYQFLVAHNIQRPPSVEIIWSNSVLGDPDEIKVKVDDITVKSLKERDLW